MKLVSAMKMGQQGGATRVWELGNRFKTGLGSSSKTGYLETAALEQKFYSDKGYFQTCNGFRQYVYQAVTLTKLTSLYVVLD